MLLLIFIFAHFFPVLLCNKNALTGLGLQQLFEKVKNICSPNHIAIIKII